MTISYDPVSVRPSVRPSHSGVCRKGWTYQAHICHRASPRLILYCLERNSDV